MYPHKRRRSTRPLGALAGVGLVLVLVLVYWLSGTNEEPDVVVGPALGPDESTEQQVADASETVEREVRTVAPMTPGSPMEKGDRPEADSKASSAQKNSKVRAAVEAGRAALEKDDVLTAQVQMSAALQAGATGSQATELRAKLVQLANQISLSPARVSGDPHSVTYVVKKGDSLRKIAKAHKITDDLIARANNLRNKSRIREGARLKIPKGPFRAVVHKQTYTMDVFLDDILVRNYKVGLGEHDSTPTGTWRIKNKLMNPTYFPPRGGKVIQADDPENPLGEHWLGLEGIAGEAKDQLRYGMHGTNEPDSIGKDMSLGCIRLHNEDVAELFTMLVVGHSHVVVNK